MSIYKFEDITFNINDDTLNTFALDVFEQTGQDWRDIPPDDKAQHERIMKMIPKILYDISCTNINYQSLLKRYARDIGELLYQISSRRYPIPEIHFFGEGKKCFFNEIVTRYIEIIIIGELTDKTSEC